jgi:phospholipid/cholesterol/gamma-HCH transport system substrate-binding protein
MRHRNEVVVGVVVILGIALIVLGTIWLRGAALGREQREVRARFVEVGQLLRGNSVKLRGVPIGRVHRIDLDTLGAGVIVTMRIAGTVTLPEDPVVILSPESMFGDWQAEIAARRNFPTYRYAEPLEPDVLPGYSLPDMSRLTAVADEIAQNMAVLSERVEIAFTEDVAIRLRRSIENITQVSDQITGLVGSQQAAIEELSEDLRETTEQLGVAVGAVARTFAQVERAISEDRLVRIVSDIETTAGRAAALADELAVMSRDMRSAAAATDSTLRSIGAITAAVERGEGSIGRLLTDTTLFISLRESNVELQRLLRDIRENPRRYITVRIF